MRVSLVTVSMDWRGEKVAQGRVKWLHDAGHNECNSSQLKHYGF